MLQLPKISIVTPSFNQGKYIEQTILSIINQGYPNLEYIIIDGGSTDETIDIIKKYEAHITYWVSESDKGQSDALNKGLAKCTGDIFNWINSDDLLEEYALENISNIFNSQANIDLIIGKGGIFDNSPASILYYKQTSILDTLENTIINGEFNQQGMFYRTECIRQIGGISSLLNYGMDLELFIRFISIMKDRCVVFTEKVLGFFRLHENSKTVGMEDKFQLEIYSLLVHYVGKNTAPELYAAFNNPNFSGLHSPNETNKKILFQKFTEKYFYEIYKIGRSNISKELFVSFLKSPNFKWNMDTFAIFIKLYVAKISFRKYFHGSKN